MLAGGGHPGGMHAANESTGKQRGTLRVALEGAATDHGAALVIEIQHRRETQVEAYRLHFGRHQPATVLSQLFGIGVVGDRAHRRQAHEALAQALHAPSFLVDGQQQVGTDGANGRTQFANLGRMLDVASEDDQPAHLGVAQDLAVLGGQPGTADVEHQRALHEKSYGLEISEARRHGPQTAHTVLHPAERLKSRDSAARLPMEPARRMEFRPEHRERGK